MDSIKSEVMLLAPIQKVWDSFLEPKHVTKWFFAMQNWHSPKAGNDFREGGKFKYRMEAKDGSFGYNFSGTIIDIEPLRKILSTLEDGRNVEFQFDKLDEGTTRFTMIFQPERQNTVETQRRFWEVVLHNFEKYVENSK